jgi:hypothetical protein
LTPAVTALREMNSRSVVLAMTVARVVLPVPAGPQPVGLDERPEGRALAEQVGLAGDLVEACRAHACRQRRLLAQSLLQRGLEEVVLAGGLPRCARWHDGGG